MHGANDDAKKLQTARKSAAKVVNTSFVPEFTTSFKLKCKCGIYHLFPWVPRSYHYFAVFYLCNLPYQLFLRLKGITIAHMRRRPQVSGYFFKTEIFPSVFKTNTRRIVFARPYKNAKQWKDDSIPSRAWVMLVLHDVLHHLVRKHLFSGPSTRKRVASVFKISTLTGERLWKDAF